MATTWDRETKKVRLVWHRIFQPSPESPLDFEASIEETVLALRGRFQVKEIRYDPYQLVAVAQRLSKTGLPMVEFPQSVPNLTESSTNLYELIKGQNLAVYPDSDIRLAISRAVALETSRGWRIAKEKVSHKIDVVVALAFSALSAVRAEHGETYERQAGAAMVGWMGAGARKLRFTPRGLSAADRTAGTCSKCGSSLAGKRSVLMGQHEFLCIDCLSPKKWERRDLGERL